jgi:ribonuclease III
MPKTIKDLQARISYHFKDEALLELALTHRSKSFTHNERLEFLGDAVLDLVISKLLYLKFPESPEGELTTARSKLVRASFLQQIAAELDLVSFLRVGKSQAGDSVSKSILSDATEALFGALFLDAGYLVCEQTIDNLYSKHLSAFDIKASVKDAKTELQEFTQKHGYSLPKYNVQAVQGADHQQSFTVQCSIVELNLTASAIAASKRQAEQDAATKVLNKIQEK